MQRPVRVRSCFLSPPRNNRGHEPARERPSRVHTQSLASNFHGGACISPYTPNYCRITIASALSLALHADHLRLFARRCPYEHPLLPRPPLPFIVLSQANLCLRVIRKCSPRPLIRVAQVLLCTPPPFPALTASAIWVLRHTLSSTGLRRPRCRSGKCSHSCPRGGTIPGVREDYWSPYFLATLTAGTR